MKGCSILFLTGTLSGTIVAQDWKFTPHIYSRGGITLDRKLEAKADDKNPFNLGPWRDESNMINNPLTEVTLEASLDREFQYFYGFDVENNERFVNGNAAPLRERVNYLQFFRGDMSLWFGSRPYRSYPEYLSYAFTFDEKNLFGGGVRFEKVGPTNIELAYGTLDATDENNTFDELTNFFINKIEFPQANGVIKTNLEIQQHKKRGEVSAINQNASGYMAGVGYSRWGDQAFGGQIYQQFLIHYSKGYVKNHFMESAFLRNDVNGSVDPYDPDFDATKLLLQWNGDWKSQRYGMYWAIFYSDIGGKDADQVIPSSEMKWTFLDSFIRPQYHLGANVAVGGEYARRVVLEEGDGLFSAFTNGGAWRWAFMTQYRLKNRYFEPPVISLYVGEMHHDQPVTYFRHQNPKNNSHFVRLGYEISIN